MEGIKLLFRIIRHNGGVWRSLKAIYIRDSLKVGTLVGTDDYGNRYYENNNYFISRNRWVEYADHVGLNYDGSQVPAEWFGWLHHRTDLPPFQEPFRPKYHWMEPHTENMSGTKEEFVPYTTTVPRITPWQPPRGGEKTGTPVGPSTPGAPKGGRNQRDVDKDCKDKTAPRIKGEGKSPPKCEIEEVKKECDKEEKKERPTCEKPVTAFH